MTDPNPTIKTTLRIPGNWAHPGELVERMSDGYQLSPESLVMPDGTDIELVPMPPDDQFAAIFASSCRQPATPDEVAVVNGYTVNVRLTGPGGSLSAAHSMMQAGAAIVLAGGAGVFIDNCGLAHGGRDWLKMTDDGSSDALSFAFVSIIRGKTEIWTMGTHVLGQPEVMMKRPNADDEGDVIIDVIRYMCASDKPIADGDFLADEISLRFRAVTAAGDKFESDSPMYNPFGRLKLIPIKEIAEGN